MKSGVFLQVRLGSMRLKEKALLPLAGLAAIRHVMRALRPIKAEIFAVLTDAESRARLEAYAREEGFAVFEGPTDDVVARYCMAARFYGVERIIRATGDNPLVSAGMADAIIAVHRSRTADLSHYLGLPLGTGVEVIETRALQEAEQRAVDPYEREHITTYLYRRRERFRVVEEPCPEALRMEGVKVSLDTDADYALLRRIYRALYRGEPVEIDLEEVFRASARTNTALEINAMPDRLDLRDTQAKRAGEVGVSLVIGTDSHSVGHLDLMRFGVGVARRGWCRASDVLNTRPVDEFLRWLKRK